MDDHARLLTREIWDLTEVASYLRVHPSTIYREIKKGRLVGFKVGRDWKFRKEDIFKCYQRRPQETKLNGK